MQCKIVYRTLATIKPKLFKKSLHLITYLLKNKRKQQKAPTKNTTEEGNEDQESNENNFQTSIPEALNSSVETEKLPNDKTLSVNENITTSERRISRYLSVNNPILIPSYLKRILYTEKRAMKQIKKQDVGYLKKDRREKMQTR